MRAFALSVTLALMASAANAESIVGRASVIDGDTLEIHGERIRILDIDTLESRQTCRRPDGTEWRCGQQAALALSDWIGARTVTCETDKLDRYERHLARCAVGGKDVGTWLAANGWAVPFRDCKCEVVRDAAGHANAQQIGIWSGSFVLPWEWRAAEASVAQAASPQTLSDSTACQIKGNISSKGERIYHVTGGKWYDQTNISPNKGERWFCSEADARAAGWRPAKQ
jgi:endonuclease YncB( thermonuclease family)